MKKNILYCIMIATLVYTPPLMANTSASNQIKWQTYEDAQGQGESQNRKYFFYFFTDWCGYCRKLDKTTLQNPNVINYINSNYIPVRINSSKKQKVAMQFNVRGVPDLRFLTTKGEKIAQWPGFIAADRLLPLLEFVHTDSYLKMNFTDFLEKKK